LGYNFCFGWFQSSVQLYIIWATLTCLHRMGGRAGTPERIAPPLLPRRLRLVCELLSAHRGCNRSMRTPMAQSHRPGGPASLRVAMWSSCHWPRRLGGHAPCPRALASQPTRELDSSGVATSPCPLLNEPAWLSWLFHRACFCPIAIDAPPRSSALHLPPPTSPKSPTTLSHLPRPSGRPLRCPVHRRCSNHDCRCMSLPRTTSGSSEPSMDQNRTLGEQGLLPRPFPTNPGLLLAKIRPSPSLSSAKDYIAKVKFFSGS
jgi:hypothetical protein